MYINSIRGPLLVLSSQKIAPGKIMGPDLGLIRDLADAAKHGGELSRGSVKVTNISGTWNSGGTSFVSNPFGATGERSDGPLGGMMLQSTPKCTLPIECDGGKRT